MQEESKVSEIYENSITRNYVDRIERVSEENGIIEERIYLSSNYTIDSSRSYGVMSRYMSYYSDYNVLCSHDKENGIISCKIEL